MIFIPLIMNFFCIGFRQQRDQSLIFTGESGSKRKKKQKMRRKQFYTLQLHERLT